MNEREPTSKRLRFEVFKRDSFMCQYCGARAPDVMLNCDHITPVASGGKTEILNLITACFDCNSGKGARALSDHAVINRQIDQLAELQERREQIELMLEWQKSLRELDELPLIHLHERWIDLVGLPWSPTGRVVIGKLISKFGFDLVSKSMETACAQCIERSENGSITFESAQEAMNYIGRIAAVEYADIREPGTKRLFYARGILRRRLSYCPEWKALALMKSAVGAGVPIDFIETTVREVTSWTAFRETLENCIDQLEFEHQRATMLTDHLAVCVPDLDQKEALDLIRKAFSLGISDADIMACEMDPNWESIKATINGLMRAKSGG